MNWFERHLNWTMVLGYLVAFAVTLIAGAILGIVMAVIDPNISEEALEGAIYVIGFIVALATLIPIWGWALRKKNQSLWYLLLGLFVPFGFIVLLGLNNLSIQSSNSLTPISHIKVKVFIGWLRVINPWT